MFVWGRMSTTTAGDRYKWPAVRKELRHDLRTQTQNKGQPFSRPVLESGTALKTVYLSKASQKLSQEQLEKAMENHERIMRKELQASGRIVRKITKTLAGIEGDVRLMMTWEILGAKKTKEYRARLKANASDVGAVEGVKDEPGRPPAP